MSNSAFLGITNLFLFIFWVRICSVPDRRRIFNPYVSTLTRWSDRMIEFFHPMLPNASEQSMALIQFVFLLMLRAALMYFFATELSLEIGSFAARGVDAQRLSTYMYFSFLGFMLFATRIWVLAWLAERLAGVARNDRASEALRFGALPVSRLTPWRQLTVIVLCNMLLVWLWIRVGQPAPLMLEQMGIAPSSPSLAVSMRTFAALPALLLLALTASVDTLLMAQNLMLFAVLLSLAAMLMQRPRMQGLAQEWIHVLLGRFGRFSFGMGGFNFAPLLFLLLVPIARQSLVTLLHRALEAIT